MVQSNQIRADVFERQIRYLAQNFDLLSIEDLARGLNGEFRLGPRQAVITFDDGYRNNLTVAAPILNQYRAPFTVFVSTEHIQTGLRVPSYYFRVVTFTNSHPILKLRSLDCVWDISTPQKQEISYRRLAAKVKKLPAARVAEVISEVKTILSADCWVERDERFSSEAPMNWDEVRALRQAGATIGSHCHFHTILHESQPAGLAAYELAASKALIEQEVGRCDYFAFPNGRREDISQEAYSHLSTVGYKAGFTTITGQVTTGCDRYVIPRVAASNDLALFEHRLCTAWLRQSEYLDAASSFKASSATVYQCAF